MSFRNSWRIAVLVLAGCFVPSGDGVGCASERRSGKATLAPERPDFVVRRGDKLFLDGKRYRFTGVNIYSLTSSPASTGHFFCGIGYTDERVRKALDELSAVHVNAVRIRAYQSFTEGGRYFDRLDFVLAELRKRGMKAVITFESQWEVCTEGGYKFSSWYRSGYKRPYGEYRMSYRDYAYKVAARYKDEPAVLMWQLMNEAESVTSADLTDPEAVLDFTRDMAAVVKKADPNHLLSVGTTGVVQSGSGGPFYALLHQIDGIDIVEAHDYKNDWQAMPQDIWLGIATARAIGKPFFIGEVGIPFPQFTKPMRAHLLHKKMNAAWQEGVDGVLIWSYQAGDAIHDIGPKDPFMGVMRQFNAARHIAPKPPK